MLLYALNEETYFKMGDTFSLFSYIIKTKKLLKHPSLELHITIWHKNNFVHLPLRFRSVILKLSAQKLLLEKILAPSLRSAKISLRCWSTSGPKAKLLTNTIVDCRTSRRCCFSKKSPWDNLNLEYFLP